MADYLPKAIESLQGIPDRNGPVVLTKHRESVIRSISAYVDCVRKVTPLRNAICHGVLTKDDDFDTVLHPTGRGKLVRAVETRTNVRPVESQRLQRCCFIGRQLTDVRQLCWLRLRRYDPICLRGGQLIGNGERLERFLL